MEEKKKSYNKERYEKNKTEILEYKRNRYKTKNNIIIDIKINKGNFILYFN